ncbi:MAG TPA: amidohydrolase [Streptosporangiaceae bacterium]
MSVHQNRQRPGSCHGCCGPQTELASLVRYRAAASRPGRSGGQASQPGDGPEPAARSASPERPDRADLLVLGTVVTMDPARPQAEGLAVSNGRVLALGSRAELDGLRGPGTEVLELGDRVAMPGLIEPHLHLWSTVLFDTWVDCSPFANPTFDDVVNALGRSAAAAPPGEWVTGKLFDPSLFPGEPELTAAIMDRIAPDNPVLVANASMHFLYANSRALAAAGITVQTADPPGGRYYRENGELTGVVGETPAMMPLLTAVPQLSHDQLLDGLVRILTTAASQGVTKVHEGATGALLGPGELDILHGLAAVGRLPTRITTAQLGAARAAWEKAGLQPGSGDDMVRAVSWKLISDGSNQGRTGYQREPYLGSAGRGAANVSEEELAEDIRYAHDHGWQVMVHANGDAAIDLTVAAYEKALAGAAPKDLRHRIEHCSLADGDHFRRMAEIGVSPSFLMNHVYYWGQTLRDNILGPSRARHLDAVASALRHGLRPSFHSDYSVSPISPLTAVQTAVTRGMRGGGTLNPDECVSVAAGLRAITIDAAWQTHTDRQLGSLVPGKYADLVILSADPRATEPAAIGDITVHQTRLAGGVAWQA